MEVSEQLSASAVLHPAKESPTTRTVESLVDPRVDVGVSEKRKVSYPDKNRNKFPLSPDLQRSR
jgi:hypothetical protein